MPVKLVCFDLDGTLLNGRLNHSLEEAGLTGVVVDNATIDAHLERIGGIKNQRALQKTMKDLLHSGVQVAITSFCCHPEAITRTLERIGLSPEEIAQVRNFSFRPEHEVRKADGKNTQLQNAIESVGNLRPEEVVLVDDSVNNYELAKQKGYQVVWVQGSEGKVDYLNELRELAGLATTQQENVRRAPTPMPSFGTAESWVAGLLAQLGVRPAQGPALG